MQTLETRKESGRVVIGPPAPPPKRLMAVANVFVRLLLRSPLHFMLSNNVLLLTYIGRKSGRQYTYPVGYARNGDVVTVFTYRGWWKNLRGGAPVVVEIKRRRFPAAAEVIRDDQDAIATGLLAHLRQHPALARGYHVPLDEDGQPDPDAVRQAARFEVMVRIRLAPAPDDDPFRPERHVASTEGAHA